MPALIDCHNVLHVDMPPNLAGLDEERLCRLLARGPWRGEKVTIVCDGVVKPGGPRRSPAPTVKLIYSGRGRSADATIIRLIDADSAPRRLTVVTNDREIQKAARRRRARVWPSEKLIGVLADVQRQGSARGAGGRHGLHHAKTQPLSPEEVDHWKKQMGLDDEDLDAEPEWLHGLDDAEQQRD